MNRSVSILAPHLDSLGRWQWPDPDCECVQILRRTGRFRLVLTAWLEEQITAMVELPPERLQQLKNPEDIRKERLRLFREAAFTLHVEEHFSRTKRDRDRIIYSMLVAAVTVIEASLPSGREILILLQLLSDILKAPKALRVVASDPFLLMQVILSSSAVCPMPVRGT